MLLTRGGGGEDGFRARPYPDNLQGNHVEDQVIATSERLLADAERLLNELEPEEPGGRVSEAEAQIGDGVRAWLRSGVSLWKMRNTTKDRYQHLRNALAAHHQTIGTTFDLRAEDPVYSEAAKRLAGGRPRVVVFGHTHLPRFVSFTEGGTYINTGTWCPTISLPPAFYTPGANDEATLEELKRFVNDLAENRLEDWTALRTLFAHVIVMPDGSANTRLCEWTADGQVKVVGSNG
jgi:hypothetical protein